MKAAKKILALIGVLLLIIVIAGVVALVYLDQIAKTAIEKSGAYALGVDTTVERVDLSLFGGEASVNGLQIDNPAGYQTPHFMKLENMNAAVTLGSLRQQTVEAPHLRLKTLNMHLEKREGKANYQVLLDNLQRLQADKPAEQDAPPPDSDAGGKTFIVRELLIEDIHVDVDLLPVGGSITRTQVQIPQIRLENVGGGEEGGLRMSELTGVIVRAVFDAILKKGVDLPGDIGAELDKAMAGFSDLGVAVVGDVTAKVQDVTKAVGEKVGRSAEEIGKAVEDVSKGAEETGRKLKESTGGLLKGLDKLGGDQSDADAAGSGDGQGGGEAQNAEQPE